MNNAKSIINKLADIIENLCDRISDSPCGCDVCPYGDHEEDEGCEVYEIIAKAKGEAE